MVSVVDIVVFTSFSYISECDLGISGGGVCSWTLSDTLKGPGAVSCNSPPPPQGFLKYSMYPPVGCKMCFSRLLACQVIYSLKIRTGTRNPISLYSRVNFS